MKYSRRIFFKTAGFGVIASGMPMSLMAAPPRTVNNKDSFKLAIAGYTFAKIKLDQTLAMMKRTEVKYLGIKNFHLPLDSTGKVIDETLAKMKSAGIEPYGVGPIYMKSEEEVDTAFTYAHRIGVKILVGVPNYELLPYVNDQIKKYNIRLAIHNHGPDTELFPSVSNIWENINSLDARMGICMDIGHTARLGLDCSQEFLKYNKRIFDIHVWDVDRPDKSGTCVETGRGIIDFRSFVKALRTVKYTGTCSLEYWKNMDDPLPGVAESIGYFRGVMAGLN